MVPWTILARTRAGERGSITSAPGFRAAGVHCGLKSDDELDLALVVGDVPCRAAAVFTTNQVQAAPVLWDREVIADNPEEIHAVVINSGCANACTGEQGLRDAKEMARQVALAVDADPHGVLVMSTGVIGRRMYMEKIGAGISSAVEELSYEGGHDAAQAIMTTDTHPKEIAVQGEIAGRQVTIAGMCKGAGMIHPQMATLLGLILTDAAIAQPLLQRALRQAVEASFNSITVDGDMSTNDTVAVLANGLAGNEELRNESSSGYGEFLEGLTLVATELAKGIVRDGEGATKFVEIQVQGARTEGEAKQVAMAIATSNLVKAAIYGEDANWGRVLAAAGYSGVEVDPGRLSLHFGDLHLVKDGQPYNVDEERAADILSRDELTIALDLAQGEAHATFWTCDLTHDYVTINAHYRT
ncbi:MAG: bifunctional glutamate N-acetyltransferase/amino-acid acetyltransferase ArgJ [Chloroflexota bacterium]|nr:bifunctional glutamate N-acetyltransferase/amino-acid acetyltransferase ArgJ [Chloroflexota bacterium]